MTAPSEVSAPAETRRANAAGAALRGKRVALVGNPNVGKTTLFNLLTRENARVGNYPGVTVDVRVGRLAQGHGPHARGAGAPGGDVEVVDVPGAYSLSARSAEEQIALDMVLGLSGAPPPDVAVVVVDSGQLVRNLYLVLQLIELRVPCVIALNMFDEVKDAPPNPEAVSRLFGVPCVATSGRSGVGMDDLRRAIDRALETPPVGSVEVPYSAAQRADANRVAEALPPEVRKSVERDRALARWALMSIEPDDELVNVDPALRERVADVRRAAGERDIDQEIILARYAFLDERAAGLFAAGAPRRERRRATERLDRILIHPVYGFVIFLAIMMVLFQSLFTWADPAIKVIEAGVVFLQSFFTLHLPDGFIKDLLVEGIIGGVGNVIVFIPQILLLFFFVGLLEDSGYMARVAYLMDRIMRSLGLHGRAFVPMLSGFACAIPAILATRTMERQRDRLLTMLVVPLMTCSARLPVYTLVIGALFPPTRVFGWVPVQGLLMVGMYLFATTVALVAAWVLGRTVVRARSVPLILELPPYRAPKWSATMSLMWDKTRAFLTEAGTMILGCTVVLWLLLSYPKTDAHDTAASFSGTKEAAAHQIQNSYGGRLGHALEPAIRPLGFDWKIGVGLIGAFAAREVFVSTLGIVYGVGAMEEDDPAPLRDRLRAETRADGRPAYTPLMGLSLMVFFAVACQCMSTLAAVRRETKTYRWPAFLFAYTVALAWTLSFAVYQGGRLLGF